MKNFRTKGLIFMALAIVINIVGGYIALNLKLPVYLDTIGTIFISILLGPIPGAIVGGLTSIVNGMAFDPTSFYFIPVQLILGITTGCLFKINIIRKTTKTINSVKSILLLVITIVFITVLASAVAAFIAAYVFDGVTSSGSSILVALLKHSGASAIKSVFSVQIFTDLLDKAIAFFVAISMINIMPRDIKANLFEDKLNGQI